MASLKELRITKTKEGNCCIGRYDLFQSANEFLKEVVESCGIDFAAKFGWNETQTLENLPPFVRDNGYARHSFDFKYYIDEKSYWKLFRQGGRGKVRVWYIDLDEVEKSFQQKISR